MQINTPHYLGRIFFINKIIIQIQKKFSENRKPLLFQKMVDVARLELATLTMST